MGLAERHGLGFRMQESMRGHHRLLRAEGGLPSGTELPFELEASWGQSLGRFWNPLSREFMVADMTGTVSAGGLCEAAPLEGTLELRYIPDAVVRYRFEFGGSGEQARRFRFEGEKRNIRPWNLHRTHTTCFGEVREAGSGELVSEVLLHFDLRQLPAFLTSLRLGR